MCADERDRVEAAARALSGYSESDWADLADFEQEPYRQQARLAAADAVPAGAGEAEWTYDPDDDSSTRKAYAEVEFEKRIEYSRDPEEGYCLDGHVIFDFALDVAREYGLLAAAPAGVPAGGEAVNPYRWRCACEVTHGSYDERCPFTRDAMQTEGHLRPDLRDAIPASQPVSGGLVYADWYGIRSLLIRLADGADFSAGDLAHARRYADVVTATAREEWR